MKQLILAAACGLTILTGCNGAAGVGVGAGAGAGAAGMPDLKSLYSVGRKWEYLLTTNPAGQTVTDTMTQEVTEVKDNKATLKVTTKAGTATQTLDFSDKDALMKLGSAGPSTLPPGMTLNVGAPTNETVTVLAGSYPCIKTTSTSSFSQNGITVDTTSDAWVNAGVGVVKVAATSKTALPAGLPSMPSMPGMPGLGGDIKTTMELKSFK